MSDVFRCERCHEYFLEGTKAGSTDSVHIGFRYPGSTMVIDEKAPFDLCPECVEKLKNFLHGGLLYGENEKNWGGNDERRD